MRQTCGLVAVNSSNNAFKKSSGKGFNYVLKKVHHNIPFFLLLLAFTRMCSIVAIIFLSKIQVIHISYCYLRNCKVGTIVFMDHVCILTDVLNFSLQAVFNDTEEFVLSIDELSNEVCAAVFLVQ